MILIPSESAMSVFFSDNLCNNSRGNYLLFFSKLSDPLRKLIPSECDVCDCSDFFFHNAFPCVFWPTWITVDTFTARTFDIFASRQREKTKTIIKSRARSRKLLRLTIVISVSGKITCVHFCTQLHNVLITYTILPKVLGHPLLMNRFDYFSNFYEYKS